MILLFDLDDTLLDTKKFKEDISKFFGLTPEQIKNRLELKKIEKKLQKLIKNIDNYLFSGAEEILIYLKSKDYRLTLMTLGDLFIQKPKVENSKIKKYFDKIIYEEKDKSENEYLKELADSKEEVLIINDREDQSLAMQKAIGNNAKIFLVKGPNSLAELKNIL